ncbi:MAG: isoamylase early set domain-containing protein [Nitrospirota bacterium]
MIKKQYLKSNQTCKVTFKLPKEAAPEAQVVTVVGDFNNWNETEAQMKKLKNGDFTLTLNLSSEKEYRYRYLIDSSRWENDWQADSYVPNPFGCDDSLIKI